MQSLSNKDLMTLRRAGCFPSTWGSGKYASALALFGCTVAAQRGDRGRVYTITAPNGAQYTWQILPNYRCHVGYELDPWLRAHGVDVVALASARLGLATPAEETAAKAAAKKTSEHRATCPFCEQSYKTHERGPRRGRVVKHGYNRPGDGYLYGECPGASELPCEYSKQGIENGIACVDRSIAHFSAALAKLRAEPEEVPYKTRTRGGAITATARRSEDVALWRRALSDAEREFETQLRALQSTRSRLTERLAAWRQVWELSGAEVGFAYRPL